MLETMHRKQLNSITTENVLLDPAQLNKVLLKIPRHRETPRHRAAGDLSVTECFA
jgi:hypothetical protein